MSRVCAAGSPVAAVPFGEQARHEQQIPGADGGAEIRALLRVRVDCLPRRRRGDERHLDLVGRAGQIRADGRPRRSIGADDLAIDAVDFREVLEVRQEDARADEVRESSGPPPRAAPSRSRGRRASASPRRPTTTVLSLPLRGIRPERNSVSPARMPYEYGFGDAIHDAGWRARRSIPRAPRRPTSRRARPPSADRR